ncbi:uncharacterized protein LOC104934912 isoform X1 [Larimichthys crocea]|uniref:uncharacterized protein LOC104934912 isoform X1 n=1 Tax=Larimichthys crocea TaxID=215358 RepID=UPI000900EFAB|nr:uncharacterized protein LOC104934912 isoform X1 [Larimichthys crocea]
MLLNTVVEIFLLLVKNEDFCRRQDFYFLCKEKVSQRASGQRWRKISNMGTPGYFYLRGVSFHIPLSAQGDARQDGLFCLLQVLVPPPLLRPAPAGSCIQFAGFMVGGMIGMMIIGITAAIWKNELEKEFDTDSSTVAELKKNLNELQIEESCCGFDSVSDWGDEIPDSCECEPTLHDACQAKPWGSEGPDLVYKTTCGSIVSDMLNAYTIFRGLSFGLAFTALIGLLISLLMLHQVNRHDDVRNTITYY